MIHISPFNLRPGSNTEEKKKKAPVHLNFNSRGARFPRSPKYQFILLCYPASYHDMVQVHRGLQTYSTLTYTTSPQIFFFDMVIQCYDKQLFQTVLQ